MKNILNRLTARKWLFALAMYVVLILFDMIGTYFTEVDKLSYFGTSPNFGATMELFEFNYWYAALIDFLRAFIPYLLISVFFFDYQNEVNAGWRRSYLFAQILIPTLIALYIAYFIINNPLVRSPSGTFFSQLPSFIFYFALAEIVVLILIKCLTWVREGFAEPSS